MRTFDERSERNLKTLLPAAQGRFRDFLAALLDAGLEAKIISGTRSYPEQAELYAQGRTKPGPIVTRAKPGYSNHNFGVAIDIGLWNGKDYLEDSPLYKKAGEIGKKMGLAWGGDWSSFKDLPHFEYPTGLTLAQMRQHVIDGIPILPEPAPLPGWSIIGFDGETVMEGLEAGIKGTSIVRAIAREYGGTVAIEAGKIIRLVKGGPNG